MPPGVGGPQGRVSPFLWSGLEARWRVLRYCYFLLMAGVSQFSQVALSVIGGFIGIKEVDAAWLEVGTPVTLDLFVNHQVAGRLTSIPRDGLTILIGPVEQPAGSEGQIPGFGSAQE